LKDGGRTHEEPLFGIANEAVSDQETSQALAFADSKPIHRRKAMFSNKPGIADVPSRANREARCLHRAALPGLITCALFAVAAEPALAQTGPQVQIPGLQVCNRSALRAGASVNIDSRAGGFTLKGEVRCDPIGNTPYPVGGLGLYGVNMSDNAIPAGADIVFTSFEQVTSSGRDTPTIWINGRCEVRQNNKVVPVFDGCRYWLMAVDNMNPSGSNGKTPDIVSIMVFGKLGKRIAYGTGPVVNGDLVVAPTPL
jgi:hypothetical protein